MQIGIILMLQILVQSEQIIIMQGRRTNSYKSQSKNQDFEQAQRLAEAIGLTDHVPLSKRMNNAYISNIIPRKQRKRRLNYSDLLPYNKRKSASQVRERKIAVGSPNNNQIQRIRKNSFKNVVIMKEAPENRPIIFQNAQNIVLKKDKDRDKQFIQQSIQLKSISLEKQRRSGILKEVSEQLFRVDEMYTRQKERFKSLTLGFSRKNPFFSAVKSLNERKIEQNSQSKLAVSLDFNKFKVVGKKAEYFLQKNDDQRRVQTGRNTKRSFRLEFNSNNRCEILCNQIDKAVYC